MGERKNKRRRKGQLRRNNAGKREEQKRKQGKEGKEANPKTRRAGTDRKQEDPKIRAERHRQSRPNPESVGVKCDIPLPASFRFFLPFRSTPSQPCNTCHTRHATAPRHPSRMPASTPPNPIPTTGEYPYYRLPSKSPGRMVGGRGGTPGTKRKRKKKKERKKK